MILVVSIVVNIGVEATAALSATATSLVMWCDWSAECQSRDILEPDSLRSSVAIWRHLTYNHLLCSSPVCPSSPVGSNESHRSDLEDCSTQDRRRTVQCQPHSLQGPSLPGRLRLHQCFPIWEHCRGTHVCHECCVSMLLPDVGNL